MKFISKGLTISQFSFKRIYSCIIFILSKVESISSQIVDKVKAALDTAIGILNDKDGWKVTFCHNGSSCQYNPSCSSTSSYSSSLLPSQLIPNDKQDWKLILQIKALFLIFSRTLLLIIVVVVFIPTRVLPRLRRRKMGPRSKAKRTQRGER